jgi:predicted MarR family transcription regulator
VVELLCGRSHDPCHLTRECNPALYAVRSLRDLWSQRNRGTTGKQGKEKTIRITARGAEACARYAQIRERLLVASTAKTRPSEETLSEIAAVLRFLSGAYEQSARAATTL